MKVKITNIDFCVEEEDLNTLVLEADDLVSAKNDYSEIVVDHTIFDDFQQNTIIDIQFETIPFGNYDTDMIFEYQMIKQLGNGDIVMELFDECTVLSRIYEIKQRLEIDYTDEIIDVEDPEEIADVISDKTGWLVNSVNYEEIDEHLSLKGQMAKYAQPDPLDGIPDDGDEYEYESTLLEVEVCSDGVVYISHNGSSGAEYTASTSEEIGKAVETYVANYL